MVISIPVKQGAVEVVEEAARKEQSDLLVSSRIDCSLTSHLIASGNGMRLTRRGAVASKDRHNDLPTTPKKKNTGTAVSTTR